MGGGGVGKGGGGVVGVGGCFGLFGVFFFLGLFFFCVFFFFFFLDEEGEERRQGRGWKKGVLGFPRGIWEMLVVLREEIGGGGGQKGL